MPRLERGVYQAPFLGPNGEDIYFSVRRDRRILRREFVTDPEAARDVVLGLERELDAVDPLPRLKLVG